MTDMPSAYQGTVLSARSRRLRTIGVLLIVAVISMAVYGIIVLMPPINHAAEKLAQRETLVTRLASGESGELQSSSQAQQAGSLKSARHKLKVQVAIAYAYWGVCALLIVGILFVSWLDLREISRNYLNQRRAIWTETADLSGRGSLAREPSSEE